MSGPPERTGGELPRITTGRVVAALCLLAPFAGILWVGSYAKLEPAFIGLPFFYWYQMLWVLISAVLTSVAYLLVQRDKAQRKARETARTGTQNGTGTVTDTVTGAQNGTGTGTREDGAR